MYLRFNFLKCPWTTTGETFKAISILLGWPYLKSDRSLDIFCNIKFLYVICKISFPTLVFPVLSADRTLFIFLTIHTF